MSDAPGRLVGRLALLWAGLAVGVAFVATPAKFAAPSLTLPVALDVGRHTFALANRLELAVLAAAIVSALLSRRRLTWLCLLAAPAAVVLAQALWLIPALDARVVAILAGQAAPPSDLHGLYIAAEAVKVAALLAAGFAPPAGRGAGG
jgi:hypothetical protein